MPTKVNLTYWDGTITDNNSWAAGCKYVDTQLYKLIDNDKWDIANGETFDLSVCPWGLPQCSLSSTANATYMKSGSHRAIVKLDEGGLRNAPFYIKREATVNKVRTSSIGDTRTDLKYRVIGDTDKRAGSTTGNVKYTTTLDTGDHAAGGITANSQPIVSLDYQTARLCGTSVRLFDIEKTDNYSNCHTTLSKLSDLLTFAATDPDEKFRVVWAPTVFTNSEDNTDRLYPVICKPYKIPDFLQAQYYNAGTEKHLYLNRDMLSIGHEDGQANNYPNYGQSNFTTTSQYGSFLATQYTGKELNFGCNGNTNNYCNASGIRQRFSDVSYHWESHLYYFAGGASGSDVRIEYGDGSQLPSFTSSKYFVAECYLVIDDSVYPDYYKSAYYALLHEMAFMGFPFTDDVDNASDAMGTANINVPVFDITHMITTGEYKSGQAAEDLPNYSWNDIFDTSVPAYDPEYIPPLPPSPDTDGDSGNLASKYIWRYDYKTGSTIYALTQPEFMKFVKDVNSLYLGDADTVSMEIDFKGSNPADYIVGAYYLPFTPICQTSTESALSIGPVQLPNAKGLIVRSDANFSVNCGKITIPAYYQDFRDYSPYTAIDIYVPMCGTISADPALVVGYDLSLEIIYDLYTLSATACIYRDTAVGSQLLYTLNGTIGATIPLTASNMGAFQNAIHATENALKQNELKTAVATVSAGVAIGAAAVATGGAALLAAGGAVGAVGTLGGATFKTEQLTYDINHTQPSVNTVSSATGAVGLQMSKPYAWVYIRRARMLPEYNAETYAHTVGHACCKQGILSDFSGYAVCSNADLSGIPATDRELSAIASALQSGIYL